VGYQPKRTVYRLQFEDPEMEGLEVRARSVSTGQLLMISALQGKAELTEEEIDTLIGAFAKALVSWNVEEEDGTPVPATAEGVKSQEIGFVQAIVWAWVDALTGVAAPLGPSSPGGEPFPEVSIPMEALSPSQAS
jgi:hypothetical protein